MKALIKQHSTYSQLNCYNFELHHGGMVDALHLSYSVTGDLSCPVVIVLGGISANHMVVDDQGKSGWWNKMVGSQKVIDTDQFCVVSLSYFWGEHQVDKDILVSSFDQARLLECLLDHLCLDHVHAIVGSSYGGMVALAFCQLFSKRVNRLVCLCAAHKNSIKTIAVREIQRAIVKLADKNDNINEGLALARSLAMVGYRGEAELEQRFNSLPTIVNGQAHFEINQYLMHNGQKFAKQWLPQQFVNLSRSIDLHHVDPASITVKSLVIAVNQDQMVPSELVDEMHGKLNNCQLHRIDSAYGHDAFLLETQQINDAIQPFLYNPF